VIGEQPVRPEQGAGSGKAGHGEGEGTSWNRRPTTWGAS